MFCFLLCSMSSIILYFNTLNDSPTPKEIATEIKNDIPMVIALGVNDRMSVVSCDMKFTSCAIKGDNSWLQDRKNNAAMIETATIAMSGSSSDRLSLSSSKDLIVLFW